MATPGPATTVARSVIHAPASIHLPLGTSNLVTTEPSRNLNTMPHPLPPLTRDPGRPVRRRTRTFRPNYLSFAGTYQCNLDCPHCCVPIEWTDRLDIPVALRFLDQASEYGIDVLGFTGGEPFVYPEFVIALTRRAADLGFRFDKVMTNGVWFESDAQLESILTELRDAGYTGKIGLSVDKFHGKHTAELVAFCRAV